MPPIQEIRDEIADGQLHTALEMMKAHFPDTIHLLSQYNTGNRQHNLGLLGAANWGVTQARITSAALGILSDYERREERRTGQHTNTSATPPPPKKPEKYRVFLSYSHKDEVYKKELDSHFAALRRSEKIDVWNDEMITIGGKWNDEIRHELETADIILFLVSTDLINSDFVWKHELPIAMERREKEGITVIPIFTRPCDFEDTPFQNLQGVPRGAKPISTFADRDAAYLEIVKAVKKVMKR